MKIDPYNFLFHPLHKDHSDDAKGLSIAVNLFLTVISRGWYLLVFGAVHAREWIMLREDQRGGSDNKSKQIFDLFFPPLAQSPPPNADFIGIPAFKQQFAQSLKKITATYIEAQKNPILWKHLQRRTSDKISHFDSLLLPTTGKSPRHGDKYRLTRADIEVLKNDPNFIKKLRKAATIIGLSYGWNLKDALDETNERQKFTGYSVRVEQMLRCLSEFGEPVRDLHENLKGFIKSYEVDISASAMPYLTP